MKVIIYGVGSLAKQLYHFMHNDNNYNLLAFCADPDFIETDVLCGLPVITFDEALNLYPPNNNKMLVAIGYKSIRNRKKLFTKAKNAGYQLINYIHPSVIIYDHIKGENNIIYPGCILEPSVEIGDNNVVWSMSLLSHDVKIGNHNYISAKCLIAGNSTIKDMCFIGNGAVLIDGLTINNESHIVAGSVVLRNTKENGVYLGNPAKLFRINENGIEIH